MTNAMLLAQIALPLSIAAVACAQWECLNRRFNARAVAPIIGLAVQPFWFYSALYTSPVQPGLLVTACFFTVLWAVGFWEQWLRPLFSMLLDRGHTPLDSLLDLPFDTLAWADTQPVDPSPDGVPWTDTEKARWSANHRRFAEMYAGTPPDNGADYYLPSDAVAVKRS